MADLTDELYTKYDVTIEFQNPIAGGTPLQTAGLIAQHMKLFAAGASNPLKYALANEGEVTEEAMQEYLTRCSSGFLADEHGIYLRGFQFNAMLKDAGQRTGASVKSKGLNNTIRDGGLKFPDKVYLGVSPTITERPVKPDNGPSNIKVFQVAEVDSLTVPCLVSTNGQLHDELFRKLWVVSGFIGLGANRHLGYGTFVVKSVTKGAKWDVSKLFNRKGDVVRESPVPEAVGAAD